MRTPLLLVSLTLTLLCYTIGRSEGSISTNKTDSGFVLTCTYPSSESVSKVMWYYEDIESGENQAKFSLDITENMDPTTQVSNWYTFYADTEFSQLSSSSLRDSVLGIWSCVCTITDSTDVDAEPYDMIYESLILDDFADGVDPEIVKTVTDDGLLLLNCSYGEGIYSVLWMIGDTVDEIDGVISQQSVGSGEEKVMISMPSLMVTSNFYYSELQFSDTDSDDIGTYWCVVGDTSDGESQTLYSSIDVNKSDVNGVGHLRASDLPALVVLASTAIMIANQC